MRQLSILILLLCLPLALKAQVLRGKVYNSKNTIENIKVFNDTQNRLTATDKNGDFTINAKVNDTILFESLFYHPKVVILKDIHFEDIAVFELKEILTELDEVEIKAEPEQPVFKEETYNTDLQNIIKEDIKNNPHLYKPPGSSYGVDFVYLIGEVVKLFKKNKVKSPTYQPITYTQMDSLFEKSSFFNKRLITENLKIPEDKIYLFYDFCEAKYISSELLKEENKMQLLEALVLNSQLFLILLEQYRQENVIKD
ncbi:carboxypeptidase-like regulatory domain-containing protein [Winogradskyella psychrotolerans]|uniref:carboxypeptidase-like regulatory domain-containing protein n=1 Tax=Winogradskyella psychrotolerans TaxID=1344585 RepID=UPI001C06960E|nr:carboxypeptidase-like regulatory domain-containing protein [Winogradskyella psychrotolerans]MBU2920331.1 carboxypeptidase-like regulatory domain-containing protein [Winogradskyella psychrotolerans]